MKRLFSLIFMTLTFINFVNAQDTKFGTKNDLPINSIEIIDKYFNPNEISTILIDYDYGRVDDYTVIFKDKTKIEFDRKGFYKNIECHNGIKVPTELIPNEIMEHCKLYHVDKYIKQITIDDRGKRHEETEIELSDGMEITFNRKYKVKEIDM